MGRMQARATHLRVQLYASERLNNPVMQQKDIVLQSVKTCAASLFCHLHSAYAAPLPGVHVALSLLGHTVSLQPSHLCCADPT